MLARSIAEQALRLPPQQRAAYLDSACGTDRELRTTVEELLRRQESATILPQAPEPPEDRPAPEAQVRRIGPYTILKPLGEGGMGIVYLAEQSSPRRTVALKVVRPHLATPRLLRRFDLEVQTLGRLQHPGIAQIHEAGVAETPFGAQPYFAMELVEGLTLVRHADERGLGTRERLALVARVCAAVQYAHTRGIIHRDLKPGNIIVDASGQPKVLDFGVARAIESEASNTMQTEAGQMVGTLPYMSPEQVAGDPDAVDTRTDVYALGVILYELLAGRLPHEFATRSFTEMVRTVGAGPTVPLVSVRPDLRGDIATIVGRALEPSRDRRYQSAAELAGDLERFLRSEPILARPASPLYVLAKFAQRNRALVAGALAVLLVLALGVAGTIWQMVRATRQRDRAISAESLAEQRRLEAQEEADTANAINDFLNSMLASADPEENRNRDLTVREMIDLAVPQIGDRFRGRAAVEARLRSTIGSAYQHLGEYEKALPQAELTRERLEGALGADHRLTIGATRNVASIHADAGRLGEAEALLQRVLQRLEALFGPDDEDTFFTRADLARVYADEGRLVEAEALFRDSIERARRVVGLAHPRLLVLLHNLATTIKQQGRLAEAEVALRESLAAREAAYGPDHPETLYSMNNLAAALVERGAAEEAEALLRRTIAGRERVLGPDHPSTITSRSNLSHLLITQGRLAEAEPLVRESLRVNRARLGTSHRNTLVAMNQLAYVLEEIGNIAEAEALYREVVELTERSTGFVHPDSFGPLNNLASLLQRGGRLEEALRRYEQLDAAAAKVLPPGHYYGALFQSNHAECLLDCKRYAEAEPMLLACHALLSRTLGPAHARTVKNLGRLARLYDETARPGDAARIRALLPPR